MIGFDFPAPLLEYYKKMGPLEKAYFQRAAIASGTSGQVLLWKVFIDWDRERAFVDLIADPAAPLDLKRVAQDYLDNAAFLRGGPGVRDFYFRELNYEYDL